MSKLINLILFILFMAFMSIVMVEWALGCGETWVDAQGAEHIGQCWILK